MPAPAERMRNMRQRRRALGLRDVRLVMPDPNSPAVRARIAAAVSALDPDDEDEALRWIEAVSEFDAEDVPDDDAAR